MSRGMSELVVAEQVYKHISLLFAYNIITPGECLEKDFEASSSSDHTSRVIYIYIYVYLCRKCVSV